MTSFDTGMNHYSRNKIQQMPTEKIKLYKAVFSCISNSIVSSMKLSAERAEYVISDILLELPAEDKNNILYVSLISSKPSWHQQLEKKVTKFHGVSDVNATEINSRTIFSVFEWDFRSPRRSLLVARAAIRLSNAPVIFISFAHLNLLLFMWLSMIYLLRSKTNEICWTGTMFDCQSFMNRSTWSACSNVRARGRMYLGK